MIDLNLFKLLNDQYGHNTGDEALKTVAGLLKSRCRSTDICARLGGDEFSIILPETAGDGPAVMREAIMELIGQTRLLWQGEQLKLGLSVGVATLSPEICTPEDLLAAADADMYRQKFAQKANGRPSAPVFNRLPETHPPAAAPNC
jgi:diguanylate cyclase (GGDEF)-like protein